MLRMVCGFPRKNICHLQGALVSRRIFLSTNLTVLREKSKFVGEDEELPRPKSLHDEANDLDTVPGSLSTEGEDKHTSPNYKSADPTDDKELAVENQLNYPEAALNLYAQEIITQNDEIRYLERKVKEVEDQNVSPESFEETTEQFSLHMKYKEKNLIKDVEKNHLPLPTQRSQLPNSSQEAMKRKEMSSCGNSILAESFKLTKEESMKEDAKPGPVTGKRKEVDIPVEKNGVRKTVNNAEVPQEKAKKVKLKGKKISRITDGRMLRLVCNPGENLEKVMPGILPGESLTAKQKEELWKTMKKVNDKLDPNRSSSSKTEKINTVTYTKDSKKKERKNPLATATRGKERYPMPSNSLGEPTNQLGSLISLLPGDERTKGVQKGILSTTANESSKINRSSQKCENSDTTLTDLALCLGSELAEERTTNLMMLNASLSSNDQQTKKDEHLSALVQCFLLDPELEEYPRLRSFLVGHKKVKKRKKETEPAQKDIFDASLSLQLFGNREELIESPEDVYNLHIKQPCNGCEVKMIDNDQQWKYPIDNQADNEDDRCCFSDHVFLNHHLDDFPQVEPVLKYMELVIAGLQKNPFLSYDKKIDKILWYKKYFAQFSEDVLL